eukprot:1139617-Pelagomonas_calceolata.AAC.3
MPAARPNLSASLLICSRRKRTKPNERAVVAKKGTTLEVVQQGGRAQQVHNKQEQVHDNRCTTGAQQAGASA